MLCHALHVHGTLGDCVIDAARIWSSGFVGLLVAIAGEQSEAFIYVTRYVHMILIVHRESGGKLRNQRFIVARSVTTKCGLVTGK